MSLLKALQASCKKIEKATTSWNENLLADLASLREEGLSTDTKLVVFDKNGKIDSTNPILVHSLILAAASPVLASILASTGDASEGFTLVLPGEERIDVENAVKDLYLGKEGGIAFLRSWGLVGGGKGKNEKVKEEEPSDEDGDIDIHDNLDDLGDTEGREDDSDELSSPNIKAYLGKEKVKRSSRNIGKISYAEEDENEDWGESVVKKKKPTEENLADDDDWKPEKVFEYVSRSAPDSIKPDSLALERLLFLCNFPDCDQSFGTKRGLEVHQTRFHDNIETKDEMEIKSDDEEDTFEEAEYPVEGAQKKTHIYIIGYLVKIRNDFRLQCPYEGCEKNFSHRGATKKHMLKVHKMPVLPRQASQPVQRSPAKKSEPKLLGKVSKVVELCGVQVQIYQDGRAQCPECDATVHSTSVFKKHYESVHLKLKETCEHCGKEYSKHLLKLHILRKHSNQRHYCDLCDYSSTFKGDIKVHKTSQHDDTKYMCEECAKEFCSAAVLKQHIRVKHGGKVYSCDQCDFKTSTTLDLLKSHIRLVHTAAKFMCKFCSFISDTNQELDNHRRIVHANEAWESPVKSNEQKRRERELQMDFSCKECGHKLTTRQGLNFHMNSTHRGIRFPCTEEGCDFTASQQVQIRQHIDAKHKGLRHYCDMCDYSASLATTVRIHKLRVHKVSPPIFACDQCKYRTQDNEKMRKHMINLHS